MDFLSASFRSTDRLPSSGYLPRDEDIVEFLRSQDFDTRLQTFNRAISLTKRDKEWFVRYQKKGDLFKIIDKILLEDRWEVQHQCIRFLVEAMPTFGQSVEYCMCYVMPNIIPKLGSSKVTVRRVSVQLIQAYLKQQPSSLPVVLKMFGHFLSGPAENLQKLEVIGEIPSIFIPEISDLNWSVLLDSITKFLTQVDEENAERIAAVGKKLERFVGDITFRSLLDALPEAQKTEYLKAASNVVLEDSNTQTPTLAKRMNGKSINSSMAERRFRFGIVPMHISALITDDEAAQRITGLEKLKQIIERITPEEIARLVPHLHSFFLTMGHVLADLNFKVVVLSLDIVRLTVNRLKTTIEAHLQQVVSLLSKHFGNQKAVIKQLIMMTCMELFQNLNPKTVLGLLATYCQENKNSRTREEVLNIITCALMMVSPSKINFTATINVLVPLLIDPKRRVRLAAFEQLSVIVYLLNNKTESLLKAVRELEEINQAKGLVQAVQARIRRALLPKIRFDGLIEYSIPPNSDSSFNVGNDMSSNENADLNWILYAGSDGNERPSSPLSLVAVHIPQRRSRIDSEDLKPEVPFELPSYGRQESYPPMPPMDRMKSDDLIIRRQSSMGSAITRSHSAQPRTQRITPLTTNTPIASGNVTVLFAKPMAISNPSMSTNSWHAPIRKASLAVEDRAASATNRHDATECAVSAVSVQKVKTNAEMRKQQEIMENGSAAKQIETKKEKLPKPGKMWKAQSEGDLLDERENLPPYSHDDAPIKPAKNGIYLDEYPYEGSSTVKKSASHYSLPITTSNHVPLKNTHSNPIKNKSIATNKAKANGTTKLPDKKSAPPLKNGNSINGNSNGNANGSVASALRLISSEEWEEKVEGLTIISKLSDTSPRQLEPQIHEVFAAVMTECKNLRSSVSRVALTTLGDMFLNLKGKTDAEVDKSCQILMQRAGDVSNAFIRGDATEALEKLVRHAHAGKTLGSIITAGAKSKSNTIRTSCAQFIGLLVNRIGVSNILNSQEHLSRLIPLLLAFQKDSYPAVRTNGRQCLMDLSKDPSFDRSLKKYCTESEFKCVKDCIGHIEKKGGVDALDSTNLSLGSALARAHSVRKSGTRTKLQDSIQLDLDEIRNDLTASGWENRLSGLNRLEEMCTTSSKIVATDTKLIEAFIGRLSDINSKVSMEALHTYMETLPVMSKHYSCEPHLKAVLNQLILALMSHLSSKSEEHRHMAQNCLKETVRQIDGSALASPFAAATKKSNVKQKPFMLSVFSTLNKSLYNSKPKQVELVSLPILFHLIKVGLGDNEVKRAVADYAVSLRKLVGERYLMDQAALELDPSKRKSLESMIS